jgi:CBS domain-containing protein
MTTIKQVLDKKGHEVWTIRPDDSVFRALEEMAAKNVGALVVTKDNEPVGIFTERHYARRVFLKGRSSPTTLVKDVMVANFIYARPGQTVEECMAVMSDKRVRHLPVLDDGRLIGLISAGDLLNSIIDRHEFTIDQLVHYIAGSG